MVAAIVTTVSILDGSMSVRASPGPAAVIAWSWGDGYGVYKTGPAASCLHMDVGDGGSRLAWRLI